MTIAGLMLFLYAPSLCRNVFFHYTTGVAAGVFLSLVLFSYLIQRKVKPIDNYIEFTCITHIVIKCSLYIKFYNLFCVVQSWSLGIGHLFFIGVFFDITLVQCEDISDSKPCIRTWISGGFRSNQFCYLL